MDPRREAVIKEALTWRGTPFHHAASIRGVGTDCAGIGKVFAAVLGQDFSDFDLSTECPLPQWHLHEQRERYIEALERHGFVEVGEDDKQPGDVVLSRIGRIFCHAGIIVDWPKVIQAEPPVCGRGKVDIVDATANWFLSGRDLKFFTLKVWK